MVFDPSIIPNSSKLLLTLDNTPISADQSDFPLTVILDSVASSLHAAIFAALGTNSKKLSIEAGSTQLPVEIEKWDSSGEKAILHVKVPTFAAATATELILSWDAAQDDNTAHVGDIGSTVGQSVWDSTFAAVYHMSQDPTGGAGCIKDSTANARNGTTYGTMTSGDLIDGQALDFDGTDDRVVAASYDHNTGQFCWEVFVKNRSKDAEKITLDNLAGANYSNRTFVGFHDGSHAGQARFFYNTGSSSGSLWSGIDHTDNIVHIAAQRDGSNLYSLYTDGVSRSSTTIVGDLSQAASWTIGSTGAPGNWTNCIIYEVRFSTSARSTDWIKLTNLSLTDQLISWSTINNNNKVSGIVTVSGSPAARTVAVFLRSDFTLLGTTTSNATTGAFEILNGLIPADANALLVTAIDSTGTYNAVSVDYITSVSS